MTDPVEGWQRSQRGGRFTHVTRHTIEGRYRLTLMTGIQTMNSIGPANSLGKLSFLIRRGIVIATFAMTFLGLVSHVQAHDIAKEMRDGANLFLKSLSEDQAKALKFKFDDDLRKNWQFIPMEREGLGLKQMKPHQRGLAMVLVQTALSHRGFSTSMQIMAMEQVLRDLENNSLKRDPAKYHLFLFGTPSAESSWGWRIEGHHLSISVTVADGKNVVIAPAFLGANPAVVKSGPLAGTSVLGDIEAQGPRASQTADSRTKIDRNLHRQSSSRCDQRSSSQAGRSAKPRRTDRERHERRPTEIVASAIGSIPRSIPQRDRQCRS